MVEDRMDCPPPGLVVDKYPAGKCRKDEKPGLQVAPLVVDHQVVTGTVQPQPEFGQGRKGTVYAPLVEHDRLVDMGIVLEQGSCGDRTDQDGDTGPGILAVEGADSRSELEEIADGARFDAAIPYFPLAAPATAG